MPLLYLWLKSDSLKNEETYDYDVDKLYSYDADISPALRDGVPAVEIDAMRHKQRIITIKEPYGSFIYHSFGYNIIAILLYT